MFNNLFFKSKRNNLESYLTFLSVIISLISSVLFVSFIYIQIQKYLSEQVNEAAKENSIHSAATLQRELDNIYVLFQASQTNDNLIKNLDLLTLSNEPMERYYASKELRSYLFLMNNQHQAIEDIFIITPEGQYSTSGSSLGYQLNGTKIKSQFQSFNDLYTGDTLISGLSFDKEKHINSSDKENLFSNRNSLLFASNIYHSDERFAGIIIYVLNSDELMGDLLTPENYHLRHGKQQVFIGKEFEESNQYFLQEGNYQDEKGNHIFVSKLAAYNLLLFYQIKAFENVSFGSLMGMLTLVILGIYFLSIVLSRQISRSILRPLDELLVLMNRQTESHSLNKFREENNINNFSFRERLLGYFLLTILVPTVLTSTIYSIQASNSLLEDIVELKGAEHDSKAALINSELNRIKKILATYSISLISYDNKISTDEEDYFLSIINYLNPNGLHSKIDSIDLYDYLGRKFYSTNLENGNFFDKNIEIFSPKQSSFMYGFDEKNNQIVIGIGFPPHINPALKNGWLTVNLKTDYFDDLPKIEKAELEFLTINEEWVWNLTESKVYSSKNYLPKKTKKHTLESFLNKEKWVYKSEYDLNNIKKDINMIFMSNSYLFFILILLLISLSYLLTFIVLNPFNKLITFFNESEHEETAKKFYEEITGINEIDILKKQFYDSLTRFNKLNEEKMEIQEKMLKESYLKKEIQLFALQNQVNPHFLYNSLDNLLFLVEDGENESAVEMIQSLTHFFRFVTDRKETWISLEQEISFTEHYLAIMKIRFDNFDVKWEIDPDLKEERVVKLIIQPIVENSIHHGVRYSDKNVQLVIQVAKQDHFMKIKISDNAQGIPEKKLKKLKEELLKSAYNKSGISNVYDRLYLYYGESFIFEIKSEINEGTEVTILLPLTK